MPSDIGKMIDDARLAGRRPRVHPNGFIQLDLDPPVEQARGHSGAPRRLHVWPEEGLIQAQQSDNTIHDHVFAMRSHVLKGALRQEVHRVSLHHYASPTHEVYVARYSCASASSLDPSGVLVELLLPEVEAVEAGETYNQPAFTFHDTVVVERPLVTVMHKLCVYDGDARVLVPVGTEPDNSFDRLLEPEEHLWEVIYQSIKEAT